MECKSFCLVPLSWETGTSHRLWGPFLSCCPRVNLGAGIALFGHRQMPPWQSSEKHWVWDLLPLFRCCRRISSPWINLGGFPKLCQGRCWRQPWDTASHVLFGTAKPHPLGRLLPPWPSLHLPASWHTLIVYIMCLTIAMAILECSDSCCDLWLEHGMLEHQVHSSC